ncbi:hypothetical protein [Kribbella sp. DT2]|uniref:hypothetical protein n=1 Tax=Kribbella sp. DT2 TaxID=3393427 RepID=UPI003CF05372
MKAPEVDALRDIARATDTQIARDIDPASWDELSRWVTATEPATAPVAAAPIAAPSRTTRRPTRRLVLATAAVVLLAGLCGATVLTLPGQDQPEALSVTQRGDTLIVRVVDPQADPKRYNQQFEKLGLDITVKTVPTSPSRVGGIATFTVLGGGQEESKIELLAAGESCPATLTAVDLGCKQGIEVDKAFAGRAVLEFGRQAEPGEKYTWPASSATGPGEELAGLKLEGRRIADVLPLLEQRKVSVAAYIDNRPATVNGQPVHPDIESPPQSWRVTSVQPWSPGEVLVWVQP